MDAADATARRRPGKPAPPQPPAGLGDMLGPPSDVLMRKRRRPIKRLNVAATSIGQLGEADDDASPGTEQA